ncbi:MAG: hypothetical protein N3B21_18810 [Clostridia bacterium]|nr:hypothetical protein [Clostridia bacterium]
MKSRKIKLTAVISGILLLTLTAIGVNKFTSVSDVKVVASTSQSPINVSMSVPQISMPELLQKSDLVAEVRIDKLKEKTIKTFEVDGEEDSAAKKENKKVIIEAPVIIYEAEVVDIIKGTEESKKIDLVLPDMNISSQKTTIKLENKYLLYLYKNGHYGNKAYSIRNFSKGIYESSNTDEIVVEGETIKLQEYKKKLTSSLSQ